jgi:hypothetical protein
VAPMHRVYRCFLKKYIPPGGAKVNLVRGVVLKNIMGGGLRIILVRGVVLKKLILLE